METFFQDVRFALRSLKNNPGFAAVAILTLALGIGANTAIFSVVNGVLLRPLPFYQPDRLITVWDSQKEMAQAPSASLEFLAYREQNTTFEQLVAIRILNFTLTDGSTPERVRGEIVSANYFTMLGIHPALGRSFTAAEDQPGAVRVALLTHAYWLTRFGGDARIVGRNLTLNGTSVMVVGVLPASFIPDPVVDFFVNPIYGVPELSTTLGDPRSKPFPHYLTITGRLKPGVTIAQAQEDLGRIIARLSATQLSSKGHGVSLISLSEYTIGDVRPTLFALAGVVGLVLLIACANVANLLLARGSSREREMAVRSAMGATAGRLARQMVTEGALLGFLGGLAGLPIGYAGVRAIVAAQPQGLPRMNAIRLDVPALLFTFAIAVLTGVLFGLAPALRGARIAPGESLKQAGRSGSGGGVRQNWLRNSLVVGEVALSLVLLIGAGLLTRSFVRLLEVKPGFNSSHLLTFWLSLESSKYSGTGSGHKMARVLDSIHRIESLPGVEAVAGSNDLPLEGQDMNSSPVIEGPSALGADEKIVVGMHTITPGYFRAMGIPLLRGREVSDHDAIGTPDVVVINQAMAQRVWPGEDPIGKHIHLFNGDYGAPEEVIGVVANVKQNGLNAADSPEAYEPFAQQPMSYIGVAVRTAQPQAAILGSIRAIVRDFDPDMPIFGVRSFDEVEAESLGSRRMTLGLVGLFAALALILASIGIYGVMSYVAASRTQEIGIRMALGASRSDVFKLMIGQGMLLAGAGLVIGAAAAAGLARFEQSLLFDIKPFDAITYLAVAAILASVALVACYLPARRATRVDPLVALRYE